MILWMSILLLLLQTYHSWDLSHGCNFLVSLVILTEAKFPPKFPWVFPGPMVPWCHGIWGFLAPGSLGVCGSESGKDPPSGGPMGWAMEISWGIFAMSSWNLIPRIGGNQIYLLNFIETSTSKKSEMITRGSHIYFFFQAIVVRSKS